MVFANTYIVTGVVTGSALPNDDVTRNSKLTTEYFYSKSFAVRFTAVLGTADSFFVCHGLMLKLDVFDLDFGELLAMTIGLLISFAPFLFKYDYPVTFEVLDNFGGNTCSADNRGANSDFATVVNQQYFVELKTCIDV